MKRWLLVAAALALGPVFAWGAGNGYEQNQNGYGINQAVPIATTSSVGGIIPDGTTITVNPSTGLASAVSGGGANPAIFGTGSDGTNTAVGCGAINASITLTRDIDCASMTVGAGAAINTNGFRIFVSGTMDISSASTAAFTNNGNSGTANNGQNGASGAAAPGASGTLPTSATPCPASANAPTTSVAGSNGVTSPAGAVVGGGSGPSGAGTASTTAGGASSAAATGGQAISWPTPTFDILHSSAIATNVSSSACGNSGASSGYDNTWGYGIAGAGAPSGGGAIYIAAYVLARGTNSATGIFQVKGGNGANAVAQHGDCSGGSSGGGGGVFYGIFGSETGTQIASAIDVSGGLGGNAGCGSVGGAYGGNSGNVQIVNIGAATYTVTAGNSAGSANSGATGGAGATSQVAL